MQRIFRSVLVAVDGSPQSNTALEMAVFLGKRLGLQTTVIHVVSRETILQDFHNLPREGDNYTPVNQATMQMSRFVKLPTTREYVLPENVVNEVTTWLHDRGKNVVNRAVSAFKMEGLPVQERMVEASDPAEKIVEEAETGDYSLIILGNSGGEEAEPTPDSHLGSVAKAVCVAARTSVLVVREKADVKNILVPVDDSSRRGEILTYAAEIAKATDAKISLLHVQEESVLSLRSILKEVGEQSLENSAAAIAESNPAKLLKIGDPAKVIIQTAIDEQSDLIVMGRGRRGILRGFMLGNVSDHVLQHATVPVLIVN